MSATAVMPDSTFDAGETEVFTVIGLYADNDQRYATSVVARDPEEAEAAAQEQVRVDNGDDSLVLVVAGVLRGCHDVVA